jgi:hypothetical protein
MMVTPRMPWLALRSDNSQRAVNGESRSSSLPLASMWTMNGLYSSDTQTVPTLSLSVRPSTFGPRSVRP